MTTRSWFRRLFTRPGTRTIRKVPRRTRLNLEQLEDRLTPSSLGLTFDDGSGNVDELPLLSYSWGVVNPSAGTGTASLQNFRLTLAPTSAEPGLWGHLAVGSQHPAAQRDAAVSRR